MENRKKNKIKEIMMNLFVSTEDMKNIYMFVVL